MKTSLIGIDLIKKWEGLYLTRYLCPAGKLTIGWGTLWKEGMPTTCTIDQAEMWLLEHIALIERDVNKLVKVAINQNQFDALISFSYNVGTDMDHDGVAEGLGDSTLLRKLNAGDFEGAAEEFLKWHHANGVDMAGLLNRRIEERALFLKPLS